MIGQERLLGKEFPQIVLLLGKYGSGKKTLIKEKYDDVAGPFSKIDDVRWVIDDSKNLSKERVYLFDGNELTYQAQNALLKITEEPNEFTRIVITGRFEWQFLWTIRTRATVIKMDEYSINELENFTDDEKFLKYYRTPGLLEKADEEVIQLAENIYEKMSDISTANVFNIKNHIDVDEFIVLAKPLKHYFKDYPEIIKLISHTAHYQKQNYNFVYDELFLKIKELV